MANLKTLFYVVYSYMTVKYFGNIIICKSIKHLLPGDRVDGIPGCAFKNNLTHARLHPQPIVLFRRIARIVAKMVTVCHTMKTYAVEAGLLDRYLVTVSMQAPRDDDKKKKKQGEVPGKEKEVTKPEESFVFDLDYFLQNKKV